MRKDLRENKKWAIMGTAPVVAVGLLYVASDFLLPDSILRVKARIFSLITVPLLFLTAVAIYQVKGSAKILPVIGLLLCIVLMAWSYFVSSFSFSY